MPNATHIRLAATAKRLIAAHGRDMALVTITNSGTGWNPTQGETTQAIIGVQSKFSASEIDGELIRKDDKLILISADVVPALTQRLRDGSTDYSIINIVEIQPGETACLYKLQVRK